MSEKHLIATPRYANTEKKMTTITTEALFVFNYKAFTDGCKD